MATSDQSLLDRVAASMARGQEQGDGSKSILSQAAASFARRPEADEATIPTGFDPQAATLFEAVVEASYILAHADGVFDDQERRIFAEVVAQACQYAVSPGDLENLMADLADQLEEDGAMVRIQALGVAVTRPEHKLEVVRIAALMAHVSGGVDARERELLDELAKAFGLAADEVQQAVDQAISAAGPS